MNQTMTTMPESAYLNKQAQRELRVRIGGDSRAGLKARNEDAFAARRPEGGELAMKGVVACVADGASCSDNAQLASQTSVTHFIADYYSTPDTWPVRTAAARVLSALNAWLFHHGRQALRPTDGLVTTFSAIILKSTTAHLLHVGDSRIWRWRAGKLELLTRDHLHHQRQGDAFLARALGMDDRLEVDYATEDLVAGDIFLLTSDGVHGTLGETALAELIKSCPAELEALASSVVERALAAGSDDNVSCLLVAVDDVPAEALDELHHRLANLALPPALQEGMVIDGYRVERVLHNGTRSLVYAVRHVESGTACVLKAPSENFADDPRYLESFAREQWIGGRIDHPAVMRCWPRPSTSAFLYILCEKIEGQSLRQWIRDHPSPSLTEVRALVNDVAAGLRAFQRLRMSHRDLKPENIMVTLAGRAKIIDFGAVHVAGLEEIHSPLGEGCPVGSVDYIAPEYLAGHHGGPVGDIYSLGVMIYEMLTGTLPFKEPLLKRHDVLPGASAKRALQPRGRVSAQARGRYRPLTVVRADLPLWLDLCLRKALEANPARRYQALSELLHDFAHPNAALLASRAQAPLIERDPIRAWQLATAVLAFVVIIQALLLAA